MESSFNMTRGGGGEDIETLAAPLASGSVF